MGYQYFCILFIIIIGWGQYLQHTKKERNPNLHRQLFLSRMMPTIFDS